jgi:Protein of unknown function (DUF2867)
MPQISPAEFHALPLRVHTFLADTPLHDVWAVDLPACCNGVTLCEFLRRTRENKSARTDDEISRFPLAARALFGLRFFLGRILGLETEPKDASVVSFGNRLTVEDRACSVVAPGTPDGLFRLVYRFENEQLVEIQNRTVHAAAVSALAEKADGYRFYFAVYVRPRTWITPMYMGLIDPFRRWVIYPALLKKIRADWDRHICRSQIEA